eukprot:1369924-Amorphochlora_amoeboformis.AAC.1
MNRQPSEFVMDTLTVGDAEPCHDFVKNEKRPILVTELTKALKELLGGRDESGVTDNGLQDHTGDLVFVVLKDLTSQTEHLLFKQK